MRQPSAQGGFGAPLGPQGYQPPPQHQQQGYQPAYNPQYNGLPQQQHQQFMPTHYAAPPPQQAGLTQRAPSVTHAHAGGYQPQPANTFMPTPVGTTSSFGGGTHEIGIRTGTPAMASPSPSVGSGAPGGIHRFGYPEDDLPLLEELGIHPAHIRGKAIAVLHPLGKMREEAIQDPDLAGPFVFAIILGFLLSLQGKVQFSAIYGLSSLGMVGFRILVGLMSEEDVRVLHIVSTLGYCLLPNLVLALVQTILLWATGSHKLALPFALVTVMWSAWCACQMFAKLFGMEHQRFLLLYPLAVFYSVFAALTIF